AQKNGHRGGGKDCHKYQDGKNLCRNISGSERNVCYNDLNGSSPVHTGAYGKSFTPTIPAGQVKQYRTQYFSGSSHKEYGKQQSKIGKYYVKGDFETSSDEEYGCQKTNRSVPEHIVQFLTEAFVGHAFFQEKSGHK